MRPLQAQSLVNSHPEQPHKNQSQHNQSIQEPETRLRLVLTTLPHFVAALIASTYRHSYYATIIAATTLASAVWHAVGAPRSGTLFWADHGLTAIWTAADTWLWPKSLLLNGIVFVLHGIMPQRTRWHLVSAGKAILVAACV
jgi:hypothetical protein